MNTLIAQEIAIIYYTSNEVNEIKNYDSKSIVLIAIVFLFSIVLIARLVDLQIINGESYREQAEKRLIRKIDSYAPRGDIYDRNGKLLVTSDTYYVLELYKTKKTSKELNDTILKIVEVLNKNGDKYNNSFPIDLNTREYKINDEKIKKWKEDSKLSEEDSVDDVIEFFIKKYELQEYSEDEVKMIIPIRYELATSGYTNYKPTIIAKDISLNSVHEIEERNSEISGVYVQKQTTRNYLYGNTLSHILGYTGKLSDEEYETYKSDGYKLTDIIGKSGIEKSFEKYLRGKSGTKRIEMDTRGVINHEEEIEKSKMGDNIYLTIDIDLQQKTEEVLKDIIAKIHDGYFNHTKYEDANCGSAVILNVKTGEVLAIASYPDYNPQDFVDGINNEEYEKYFDDKNAPMYNRAIQGLYPPGSTFKMVTGIAGIESGAVKVNEYIKDLGIYNKGHKPACWIWNSRRQTHGNVNAMTALKVSCNYYYYEVANRIGIDKISEYARKFGLGEKTGIEIYGESKGTVSSKEYIEEQNSKGAKLTWTIGDTLSSAIGQSYNAYTPLQMAYYISTLANKGKRTDLTIIKDITTINGMKEDVQKIKNEVRQNVGASIDKKEDVKISDEAINAIFAGMRSVTGDRGGTVYGTFNNFPIEVAGKTGTATSGNGSDNAWFVGFAPYDNPEIAVVIIVEHGGHGYFTAGAVKDIMEMYFGFNNQEE